MIRWNLIRTFESSQTSAFEELCSQLARHETGFPVGSKFVRKGRPDAGVECLWRTPEGKETAWQAKYFLTSLTDSQWGQCDSSVKTALDRHPDLDSYIFCIPIDLPDGRLSGTTSARERWDEHVDKWAGWAADRGMEVSFELWGSAELTDRLSREEHRGRRWFWFENEALTQDWMHRRFQDMRQDLDLRYRPDLHVDVGIQEALRALIRHPEAVESVAQKMGSVASAWNRCPRGDLSTWTEDAYADARTALSKVQKEFHSLTIGGIANLDLKNLRSGTQQAITYAETLITEVRNHYQEVESTADKSKTRKERECHLYAYRRIDNYLAALHELQRHVTDTLHFAEDPFMVLTGEAGIGKSHVLAHCVEEHIEQGRPAIMLLGEYFSPTDPWSQIITHLGLGFTGADTFLGALQASAEATGHRALIVIDALNEHGANIHRMWERRLAGMRQAVARFPGVAFAASIRSPMEGVILPRSLSSGPHIIWHPGFAGAEGDALTSFLGAYKLPPPESPLLLPEYSNPLFLVLYCEALKAREQEGRPLTFNGFAEVLDAWLDAGEKRAAVRMGTDPHDKTLKRGVTVLAAEMLRSGRRLLPRSDAKKALESVHAASDYQRSLFLALVSENIFVEVSTWGKEENAVRFQYERFQDFFIASALLDSTIPTGGATPQLTTALTELWKQPWANGGVLHALSILLPNRTGRELHELAPSDVQSTAERTVLRTLPWRAPEDIGPYAIDVVQRSMASTDQEERWRALRSILLICSVPHHPLNSRFLHAWLAPMTMHDRDIAWSAPLLYYHDEQNSPSQRLLDWCSAQRSFDDLADEARLLLAVALGWMLSSSHRPLRDHATKALVHLFARRLDLLQAWMTKLWAVNDMYVVERVLAVAYGAVIRSEDPPGVAEVAYIVFNKWFRSGQPPVHILARDYARNIVEFAHVQGTLPEEVDEERASPPYQSTWPEGLPSQDALKARFGKKYSSILGSMVDGGDFDCYEVGSNTWSPAWRPQRKGESLPPLADQVMERFQSSLDTDQTTAFEAYRKAVDLDIPRRVRSVESDYRYALALQKKGELDAEVDGNRAQVRRELIEKWRDTDFDALEKQAIDDIEQLRQDLTALLAEDQREAFEGPVRLVLAGQYRFQTEAFSLELAYRYLMNRVLELGWDESTLGELDRAWNEPYSARSAHKPERLGKKYQWLALHSFLAAVSDSFLFRGGLNDIEGTTVYEGPWQVYKRDIDPTCLIESTRAIRFDAHRTWWSPEPFDDRREDETDDRWLSAPNNLPDPRRLLEVQKAGTDARWLVLDAIHNWKETIPPGFGGPAFNQRTLWYWPRGYLVHAEHLEDLLVWARKQNFHGRWMPEVSEETPQLMLRERGWSKAWSHFDCFYHGRPGWSQGRQDRSLPRPVKPTWDYYMAEGNTQDCSIEEGYTLHLPCPDLVEVLGIKHSRMDGCFVDSEGRLAVFDPTISEVGPGALLLRVDQLEVLRSRGLEILWIILGEQRLREVEDGSPDEWLGGTEVGGAFVRRQRGWEGTLGLFPIRTGQERRRVYRFDYLPGQEAPIPVVEPASTGTKGRAPRSEDGDLIG